MTQPGHGSQADRHHEEAVQFASTGRLAEAVQAFQSAVQLEPANAIRYFNLGRAQQQQGDLPQAAAAYTKAVELEPSFFEAWCNLSAAWRNLRQIKASVSASEKAVGLRPNSAAAWLHLGNAVKGAGDLSGAEGAYRKAVDLEPANAKIALNLANTIREAGRLGEAIPMLRGIVARVPKLPEAHRDLAFALLLNGDLAEGWIENEWRWDTDGLSTKRRAIQPGADAGFPTLEALAGKTVLVYTEQGFGDAIQFVRYAPLLAERGVKVVLECQPPLERLFRSVPGVQQLLIREQPIPEVQFQLPLLSLPRLFQTGLESIPASVPYLHLQRPLIPSFSSIGGEGARLVRQSPPSDGGRAVEGDASKPKIGLVWAGNAKHENDANRSLPGDILGSLADKLHGAQLFSLQTGPRGEEGRGFVDLAPSLTDFAATAAIIQQLDLVISVDTSVAHLAGALAKPVWILLPFAPDWRWLLGTDRSPWYSSARLFRQPKPNDWGSVLDQVARAAIDSPPT